MKSLRIGTRGSALALWQSRHVAGLLARTLPGLGIELVEISSLGDRVTDVPLSHVEGTGFFTASIEQALLANEVDIAVHSYKDLPVESTPGLIVAAVPQRGPVEDVLLRPRWQDAGDAEAGRARRHLQRPPHRADSLAARPIWNWCRCAATCRRGSRASTTTSMRSCWRAPDWCGSGSRRRSRKSSRPAKCCPRLRRARWRSNAALTIAI